MAEHTQAHGLIRLQTWLSPAFPVGSFAYSHGLESAVEAGLVTDAASLSDWLETLIHSGSGWNDAVLFAEAWRRARGDGLEEVAQLAEALSGSAERHMESVGQGNAFLAASASWPAPAHKKLPATCPYCVAVGAIAGAQGVPLEDALAAFINAFATNLLQAGIRLGVVGQSGAVAILAGLEPVVLAAAKRAVSSSLEDLGTATMLSEIMAMRHETHFSRLFRS